MELTRARLLALLGAAALLAPAPSLARDAKPEFKVGVARADITPAKSIWMSGYASRKKPSESVTTKLWAKALAIEDAKGRRVVIVTTDLIGLPRVITDEVSARAGRDWKLDRSQLLFNSSHTHTGPVVRPNLSTMYDLNAEQQAVLAEYARSVVEALHTIIGASIADLAPASLAYAQGTATFAANRRQFGRSGAPRLGLNERGPIDHSVPVLEVRAGDALKAVLFGYTCHNTTLTGDDYAIDGDYAGYAQSELERRFPGVTALFLLLCGGDQNPNPRGKREHAEQHGKALADAVAQAAGRTPIRGRIKSALQLTDLAFKFHTREQFEAETKDPNQFKVRRAKEMIERYDAGRPLRTTPYPVQALRFGKDLTILALGGEVVIDYQLRAKREFSRERLIVAGYSNDVMCYIPSLRVLKEGGYEADTSMIYYGMPGPFDEDVEDRVFAAIRRVMKRVGAN